MRIMHAIASSLLLAAAACGASSPNTEPPPAEVDAAAEPATALSAEEAASLAFMREEEKLARDVYDALDGHGQAFVNIQLSEQRHFDAVGALLATYGLPDPAATTGVGEFTDPSLQALYATLVAQGTPSRLAALEVGCLIEELDLRDLRDARAATARVDIQAVYDNLMLGSRNHLRAFYGQLVADGGSYTPAYLDQASFDAIVTSPREQGAMRMRAGGHGAGHGACGAGGASCPCAGAPPST